MSGSYRSNGQAGRTETSHRPVVKLTPIEHMSHSGAIKWYDHEKRFGFIIPDAGGQDVFLHISTINLYGIRPEYLITGARVRFDYEPAPGRRPNATAIAIA